MRISDVEKNTVKIIAHLINIEKHDYWYEDDIHLFGQSNNVIQY